MNYNVHGQLVIPLSLNVEADVKNEALLVVQSLISKIIKLDGDLYLNDERKLPIIADKVIVEYLEALSEDEL